MRGTEAHAKVDSAMHCTCAAHAVTGAYDLRVGIKGEMLHHTAKNIVADAFVRLIKPDMHLAALQHQRNLLQDGKQRLVRAHSSEVGVHGHRMRLEVLDQTLQTCRASKRYP